MSLRNKTAILLLVVMLFFIAACCNKETVADTTAASVSETTTTAAATDKLASGLLDAKFDGEAFTFLNGKVTRDEESSAMLDILSETLTYYHPVARTYVNKNITARWWAGNTDFSSYFASNEATIARLIN